MQRSNRTAAFTIRVPIAIADELEKNQMPGLNYRAIAQQAIAYCLREGLIAEVVQAHKKAA